MKKTRKISAYMTLEASFIIPLTIFIFLIIIYFGFYLYDQCVVSQGCYLAALRGSQVQRLSDGDVKKVVEKEVKKLLEEQVFINNSDFQVHVDLGTIEVNGQSTIKLRLPNKSLYDKDTLETDKSKQIKRLNPVLFIRECQKVN